MPDEKARGSHRLEKHEKPPRLLEWIALHVAAPAVAIAIVVVMLSVATGLLSIVGNLLIPTAWQVQSSTAFQPAPPKTARFATHQGATPLVVDLVGGNYDISYETSPPLQLSSSPGNFVANFRTGATRGSLQTANVIVLVGDVDLSISDIGFHDQMTAEMFTNKGAISSARFRMSTDGRQVIPRRRVVIVGSLYEVNLGASSERSRREVLVLEHEDGRGPRGGAAAGPGTIGVGEIVKDRTGAEAHGVR